MIKCKLGVLASKFAGEANPKQFTNNANHLE